MTWLAWALICAFGMAMADASTKRGLGALSARQLLIARCILPLIVLVPLAIATWPADVPRETWAWLVPSAILEVIAVGFYLRSIQGADLSQSLPYHAFTPVLVAGIGGPILGEAVSGTGLAGILLVFAGAWLLNINEFREGWHRPLTAPLRQRSARLMLLAASIYAFTGVFSRAPLAFLPPTFLGALYFTLVGVTAWIGLDPRGRVLRTLPWRNVWLWATVGWMTLMIVTHFVALVGVKTAYMLAVKRTSLLWGIVLGALWLGEPDLRRNLLAGGVMVAGVALIALA